MYYYICLGALDILEDADGNTIKFDSYEEAEDYIEEYDLEDATISRRD